MTSPAQSTGISVAEHDGVPVVSIPDGTNRGNGKALASTILAAIQEALPRSVHKNATS